MNREELYHDTINIVLDAYNNQEMLIGDPCKCFIGNIISKRYNGLEKFRNGDYCYSPDWYFGVVKKASAKFYKGEISEQKGIRQIESTGYTLDEVIELERNFESFSQYNELAAIESTLIKLAEIHETNEKEYTQRLEMIYDKVYC